jgi:threonine dehydratase
MAGNGTIGLEIIDDLADVDVVLVPWGGGGLACGIAAALRAVAPSVRVYACEVEGAAPLSASLTAGQPVLIQNQRSFIDGIGGRSVFADIWPLARNLIAGALTVSVSDVADAVRLLANRNHIVAEGAGAVPLAVARRHVQVVTPAANRVACIVSGGNIDASVLATILSGTTP